MESVSMLNLNMGTLPSSPRGLLLFFLFFSDYLQFLLPFCNYSDTTKKWEKNKYLTYEISAAH